MAKVILREESIRMDVQKPWCGKQVDSHLSAMLYWVRHGYEFTGSQKEQLGWLCELIRRQDENV